METITDRVPVVKPEPLPRPVRRLRPCDQCWGNGFQPTEEFELEACPCCGGGGIVTTN